MNYIKREALAVLHVSGIDYSYWLLAPYPIEPDDWQHHNERRFVGVPMYNVGYTGDNQHKVYPHARHIVVCGDYTLEYRNEIIFVQQSPEEIAMEEQSTIIEDKHGKHIEDIFTFDIEQGVN
jgi:hypothetical protein